jgi:hypothetical protein
LTLHILHSTPPLPQQKVEKESVQRLEIVKIQNYGTNTSSFAPIWDPELSPLGGGVNADLKGAEHCRRKWG